jgi:16S rRNA (cytosine1402-N4)-methyltransferase
MPGMAILSRPCRMEYGLVSSGPRDRADLSSKFSGFAVATGDESTYHVPVMRDEVLRLLEPRSGGVYLDGTAGGGGHTQALLEASSPDGRVCALDQDPDAVAETAAVLARFGRRLTLRRGNFSQAGEVFPGVLFDGILLDLGVSSHQLSTPERGFSCDIDGPLDMRMDTNRSLTAASYLAFVEEAELGWVLRDFGETPFFRRISREIVRARERGPLTRTGELAAIVRRSVPVPAQRKSLVQVFQALRIQLNDELGVLERGLGALFEILAPGGRLAVIAYHSLEDRLSKRFFAGLINRCTCPPDLPVCVCGRKPLARVLTRKPLRPSGAEVESNPRSRSACLRAAEKLARPAE